jgi:hypothetical protein
MRYNRGSTESFQLYLYYVIIRYSSYRSPYPLVCTPLSDEKAKEHKILINLKSIYFFFLNGVNFSRFEKTTTLHK